MTILSVPSIRLGVSARLGLYSHSTEPCRNYLVPSTKTRLIRCSDGSNRRALTIASMNCHVGHCFSPKALLGAQRYYHALLERPEPWLGYAACNAMTRNYASESNKSVTADEYILELQDLYEIAKDELEIAVESTDANSIYAAADRESLREAFDVLNHAYAVYTGAQPPHAHAEQQENNSKAATLNSDDIPLETREEIKRRVGQRIRELRNAVEILEERSQSH